MKKHYRDFLGKLSVILEPHNAVVIGIEESKRHHKVLIQCDGRVLKRALPGSPSDHRSMTNSLHDIRNMVLAPRR